MESTVIISLLISLACSFFIIKIAVEAAMKKTNKILIARAIHEKVPLKLFMNDSELQEYVFNNYQSFGLNSPANINSDDFIKVINDIKNGLYK